MILSHGLKKNLFQYVPKDNKEPLSSENAVNDMDRPIHDILGDGLIWNQVTTIVQPKSDLYDKDGESFNLYNMINEKLPELNIV